MIEILPPFPPVPFLGHGFGIIPAPGSFASSAFSVPPCRTFRVPPRMQPLALGAVSTPPSGAPRKWGGNGEKSYVSQSRPAHWLPRQGARETPSPRKRHELHRAVRRDAAVLERCQRRVAFQDGVAPRRDVHPPRRSERADRPQGRPRARGWHARQLPVRARERQVQKGQSRQARCFLERSRQLGAAAKPRRSRSAAGNARARRQLRRCAVLTRAPQRPSGFRWRAFVVCPASLPRRKKLTLRFADSPPYALRGLPHLADRRFGLRNRREKS